MGGCLFIDEAGLTVTEVPILHERVPSKQKGPCFMMVIDK